ncbi:DUF6233 domain-containing protein [Streptomyces alfalfae]|uniref:DUF6233 domain-containing protein n=1 Tax=Streptomyces alfalfae TaxID=1642299 RepID=UPI0028117E54|nr:DUF6233 domain-containing protein [Streptomyces alfalfae]
MNDRAPLTRLDLLRFLERVQLGDLERTRTWIADEERRQAEQRRGEQSRPPAPDWTIEQGLDGRAAVYVHAGGCHMAGKRSRGVPREQAWRALTVDRIEACPHCRPDTALGVLE